MPTQRFLRAILCLFATAVMLRAQVTWTSSSDSTFGTSANWSGALATDGTANVTLSGSFPPLAVPVIGSALTINSLTYGAGTTTLNLTGAALTIQSSLTQNSSLQTITAPLTVGPTFTFSGPGGQTFLQLNGGLTAASGFTATNGLYIEARNGNWTTGGTVTLQNGAILEFFNGTYTLGGNFVVNAGSNLNFGSGATTTVNGAISGGGSVNYNSPVTLNAVSTYAGASNIGAAVTIGTVNALPTTGTLTFSPAGALAVSNNQTVAGLNSASGNGSITIASGRTLIVSGTTGSTFSGAIGGSGALTRGGTGTLTLTGANTYAGGTTIDAGATLQVGNNGTTGSISGNVVDNGTLQFARSDALTFGGVISGTGGLSKIGSGTLTLSGANTYGGNTNVSNGGLADGGANAFSPNSGIFLLGATTSLGVNFNETIGGLGGVQQSIGSTTTLASGTTLTIKPSGLTYAGAIGGAGALVLNGTGTQALVGPNTYSGGTTIGAGTILQIGASGVNSGTTGSIAGNVVDNGTLIFARADDLTFGGTVSGPGSLVQNGNGVLTLTGANSFSGPVTISSGTVRIGDGGTAGSIATATVNLNSGTLAFNRSDAVTFAGGITGNGGLMQVGPGTLILTGSNNFSGTTTVQGGTLQIGANGTTGSLFGSLNNNGTVVFHRSDNIGFGGSISGTGDLVKRGAGTLSLFNTSNTYSGKTTIESGVLAVSYISFMDSSSSLGAPYDTAKATIAIGSGATGATLRYTGTSFTSTDRPLDLAGTTGGATLDVQSPFGSVNFQGPVTASGAGSKTLTLMGNSASSPNTISGVISDNSATNKTSVVKTGFGTWILSGANTFTGGVAINNGTLRLAGTNALGTNNVTVNALSGASGALLDLSTNTAQSVGSLTLGGAGASFGASNHVVLGAGGTLTLGGDVTFNANNSPQGSYIAAASPTAFASPFGGNLSLGGATRTFNVGDSSNASVDLTILASISATSTEGIIKTGDGSLLLGGNSTYGGGTTVQTPTTAGKGALLLASSSTFGETVLSGPVGRGTLTLQSGTTLAPAGVFTGFINVENDITLHNAVSVADGVTLGAANSGQTLEFRGAVTATNAATTLRLAGDEPVIFTGSLNGAAAGTTVTFNTAGPNRSVALFGGSFGGNLTSVTADRAAIIFGTPGSLANSTVIKATNGGYVGVGYANGSAPAAADLLARILASDPLGFNGTFGFDTADHESAPHVFADALDFSNFGSNFTVGSLTGAVLTGTIKPTVVGGVRTYQFGNGGGTLVVRSALGDDGGLTSASVNSAPTVPQNALTVIFQGGNTYTGGLSVTNSAVILDSAGALPAGGSFTLGANGYAGYTTAFTPATSFAGFVSRLAPGGYTSSSILGFDSSEAIAGEISGSPEYYGYPRFVSEPVNLSGLNSIYLGTATSASLTGRIIAPAGGNLSLTAINGGFLHVGSSLRSPDVSSVTVGTGQTVHEPGTVMLAGRNTYGGGTTLLNGTLMIEGSSQQTSGAIVAGPLGTGALTIASSATTAALATEGYDNVVLHNNIALGAALQIGLPSTFYGGDELSLSSLLAPYGQLTLSGAISDLGTAHGSLDVFTDVILNGGSANTFTGGVRLHSGTLTLGKDSALGAAASTLTVDPRSFDGETAFVSLYVPEARTLANSVVLNGFAGLSLALEGPGSVFANGARTANSLTLQGTMTLNGNVTLELSNFPVFVNGNVVSGGFGHLDVTGHSAVVLNGGNNTYNGGTTAIDGAIIFGSAASIPAQPAAGLLALSEGYIGVASTTFSTSLQSNFLDRFNKGGTTGTIGFDTPQNAATNVFSGSVSLATFNSNARLGSASHAVLTGTITPQNESYRFGGGGGLLEVTPATGGLSNGVDLTRNLQVTSEPGAPLTLRLGGTNTYTGGTTVGYSGLIFQQGALPPGSIYLYGTSYVGTEDTDSATFLSRLSSGFSGSPIVGFDSFTGTPYSLTGTLAWPVLDGQPVFLGTSTKANLSATLTSGGTQNAYRFAGFKGGELTVSSLLADANSRAYSVQVGDVINPSTYRSPVDAAGKLSTVILTGANTYTGGTDLNGGQLLFGSSSTVAGGNITSGPLGTGTLRVSAGNYYYGGDFELPPATLGATVGGLTLANQIALSSTLNLAANSSFTLSGNIVDGSSFVTGYAPQLYKTGNGTVTLSGNNTFSGGIYVAQGGVTFASANAAGTGPLQLGTIGPVPPSVLFAVSSTINGLFGDNALDSIGIGAGTTLTINQTSDSQYLGSFTSSGGSLVFKGPTSADSYRLRLGGASSYNGGTDIRGGINLFVTNDSAFGPATNSNNVVTLNGGKLTVDTANKISNALTLNTGTLAGTGTFQPPATLHINGTAAGHVVLAPGQGDGPGTLQFNNTNLGLASAGIVLSLEGGGIYRWQVADALNPAGGWDTINVAGNVNITAGSVADPGQFNFKIVPVGASELLASVANFNPNVAGAWTVLSANSILGFNANAFAIDSSSLGSLGAGTFFFTLNGGNSLVLNFSPVPEPSTYAMIGFGALAIAFSTWRRRRSR